jgi:hypothetical protein
MIDGEIMPWGTTLAELRALLKARGLDHASPHDEFLRGRCRQACGFPAISFQEEGLTAENRPLCSLTYHLAPYDAGVEVADPRFWADPITAALGEPIECHEADAEEREGAGEGSVLYYARWQAGVLTIGLSVFGGQRPEATGHAAAYLYLSWTDAEAAARPYLAEIAATEERLEAIAAGKIEFQVFKLQRKQSPACEGDDVAARRQQRALRGDGLFDTPAAWHRQLKDNQAAFWQSADGTAWGLANRWDTILFQRGEAGMEVRWWNILPGRFEGSMEFQLGALTLNDEPSSRALRELVERVGRQLGRKLEYSESRNDY